MQTLLQDVRFAARALGARPGFAIVAILTLTLAIGATTALFSVVYGVLLRRLPYPEADRVLALWQTARDNPEPTAGGSVSYDNYRDWKREARLFESMALYASANYILSGHGDAELVQGGIVTPDFFRTFGASPVLGREFTPEEDRAHGPNVVIVSYGFWTDRLNGRADVIGSTTEISGRAFEIVGVAPPGFSYPRRARLWTPVQNDDTRCGRDCVYLDAIGRLAPGASLAAAREEMRSIAARLERDFPDANTNVAIGVTRLQDQIVGDVRPALVMLFGAVTMVLLIACANVANLMLVRGVARRGEVAIRTALGAGRRRLLQFLLAESATLAAAGAACGLLLAWWGIDLLKHLAPADLPRLEEIGFSAATFAFALGIGGATVVLFGVAPALQVLDTPASSLLNLRSEAAGRPTSWSRTLLLAVEVALSLVLLIGAGLLLRSMHRLQAVEPGWSSDRLTIFTIGLPSAHYPDAASAVGLFEDLDRRLGAAPGMEIVARINGIPLGPGEIVMSFTRTDRAGPAPGEVPNALYRSIDADYFRAAGIPLLAGRHFDTRDGISGAPAVIISREMAERFWPGEDPVGKAIRVDTTRTIVGVVEGVRSANLSAPPQPEMYVPHAQTSSRAGTFVIKSTLPAAQVLGTAREVVRAIDPRLPLIRPGTLAELEAAALARPRFYLLLLGLFAVLAVALAAIGIYGVVAYAVSQRTREIGVRMALGATAPSVVGLIVWQGLRPALAGVVIGLAGALAGRHLIAGLLYGVEPADPLTMAAVIAAVATVVIAACVLPAYRATKIQPGTAMRQE